MALTRDLQSQTLTAMCQTFSFFNRSKTASRAVFCRIGAAACSGCIVPTVENFFVSGYKHASSTVFGVIFLETIGVNSKVSMTFFIDGLLGFLKLDVLGHRLIRCCRVARGWGGAVSKSFEPQFAGLVLRIHVKFTQIGLVNFANIYSPFLRHISSRVNLHGSVLASCSQLSVLRSDKVLYLDSIGVRYASQDKFSGG